MPAGRDFLSRFRPAGAPGAAARAGVPADRARELAGELEPVLALLDGTHAECERIVAEARQQAARIVAAAREEASRIGAEAAARAGEAGRQETGRVLGEASAQAAQAVREAGEQARVIRERVARRLPALVARGVELALAVPQAPPQPAAGGRPASPAGPGEAGTRS
jgi:cell division septum initiation protein DivIVA